MSRNLWVRCRKCKTIAYPMTIELVDFIAEKRDNEKENQE